MMESLIKGWDGEALIVRYDQPTGAWIFIAIHSTRLGPATGGIRIHRYPSPEDALRDALRLATGMTYKFAVPGISRGGGYAVISVPDDLSSQSRSELLRLFGRLIHQLNGLFYIGPDVGTTPEDMDIIAETGDHYVFCRTPASGGAGSPGPITALGVLAGIQVACKHLYGDSSLKGRSILVQGVGRVGKALIENLCKAGAKVMFNEMDKDVIRYCRDELGLEYVPYDMVYTTECDIFAPCALGGGLNAYSIPQLKCKIVAGGANNQLAGVKEAERLRERGILYAPDFVINVGAAMAIPEIESLGWSQEEAEKQVVESISGALRKIFESAENEGITTETAARRIAESCLSTGTWPRYILREYECW